MIRNPRGETRHAIRHAIRHSRTRTPDPIAPAPGVLGLLLVLFVGLKLCGVIRWSWWWVTAPMWLPVVILIGVVAVFAVFLFGANLISELRIRSARKRRRK